MHTFRLAVLLAGMYTCLSGFVDQCESIEEVRAFYTICAVRCRGARFDMPN